MKLPDLPVGKHNLGVGQLVPPLAQKGKGCRNEVKGNPAHRTMGRQRRERGMLVEYQQSTHTKISACCSQGEAEGSLFLLSLLVKHLRAVHICKPLARTNSTCWKNKSKVCYSRGNHVQWNQREVGGTGSWGPAEASQSRGRFTNIQSCSRWLSNPS